MNIEGRVAIVTGASSGIGASTARLLAEEGARVVLFARREESLKAVAAASPDRMIGVAGDVADAEAIERLFLRTESHFGECDILVNCAGSVEPRRVVEMTREEWDREFAVNVGATFSISKRALPAMLRRRRGSIVNVASISGVLGPQKFPGLAAYCASKAAVISFTECLAVELRDSGVRVNCVSPGSVDTPMLREANPALVPDMTPLEVAEVILFLASERSRPINGQNIHVYSS